MSACRLTALAPRELASRPSGDRRSRSALVDGGCLRRSHIEKPDTVSDGPLARGPGVHEAREPEVYRPEDRVDILLVDDRPENLVALEAVLDGLGQNLVKAQSGNQALKCLLKQDFAVILLDVLMPGLDG